MPNIFLDDFQKLQDFITKYIFPKYWNANHIGTIYSNTTINSKIKKIDEFYLFQGTLVFSELVFYGEINHFYFLIVNCSFLGKILNVMPKQNELILNSTEHPYYYFVPISFQEFEHGFILINYNDK